MTNGSLPGVVLRDHFFRFALGVLKIVLFQLECRLRRALLFERKK